MAKQMKYGRYLHGGDYNPEQWLALWTMRARRQ